MIAWWMAQVAVIGALLAVAAFGAESALKIARRPTRWVWIVAMGLTVALGVMAPNRFATGAVTSRMWRVTDVRAVEPLVNIEPNLLTTLQDAWHDVTTLLAGRMQGGWNLWHRVMPSGIERWLAIAWVVTSVTLLLAFVAVHLRYQRRRSQWPLGDVLGTTVRIASDTGPAVIGVTSAEIVLPQWLLTRDDREQRLVLEHELEHVRQHDPLLLAMAQAAVVLVPWHPAVWWMASRLRLAIELDCDGRVLQRGASARDYGTLLIDLTDHRTGFGAALPAFSCSPSHLERRLVAMTPKRLRYPLVRVLATGVVTSLALLAACEARLPTSDEMDRMTASSATQAAGRVAMIDTSMVTYFINGRPATKGEADNLAAERIASVNVMQKGARNGGEVRIVTREVAEVLAAPGDTKDSIRMRINYTRTDPTRVTFVTPGDTVTLSAPRDSFSTTVQRTVDGKPRSGFTGLMIVDGVITDPAIANRIAPDQIVSVDVTKGVAATSQYSDPRAVNGVIRITTKKAKP